MMCVQQGRKLIQFIGARGGEIGLLCECDRTASVMTEAYTTSAYINKEQFRDLCEQYPEAAMSIKGGLKKYDDKNK